MGRPRRTDVALLVCVLVLWSTCAVLHLRQVVLGRLAWVPVYVEAPSGESEFPRVRALWPGVLPSAAGGVQIGDHLLRVGAEPLRGVGPIGFVARVHEVAAASGLAVPVAYERNGVVGEASLALVPAAFPWRMLPLACSLVVTAALVLLRRGDTAIARPFFLAATAFAIHWTFFFGGPRWQTYAWVVIFFASSLVMLPLILRAALIFPPEVAPARTQRWPWLFALFGPLALGWVFGVPFGPDASVRGAFFVNVAFIATFLVVLTRSYRHAGPIGRRQLKWMLLGMYVGLLPVLLADAVVAIDPALSWVHEPAVMAEVAIPISILIAIARFNLFDVDQLITRAAAYSLLSIVLLAAALFAVPRLARVLSLVSGLAPRMVEPLLSVAVAAGVVPGARVLQPRVERVLFRERHALRTSVEGLLRELAAAANGDALFAVACTRLDAILSPRSCAIYAALDADLVPVVVASPTHDDELPTLASEAPLLAALRAETAPLDVQRWLRARSSDERTAETLGAAVLVPVRPGGALAACISLGPKRSGDVYTPTDLALLAAVGDKLAGELMRLATADVLRHERATGEALRRYVPAPVAARLTRGQTVEGGERDVSVLFVDIRGYTTFSERRGADAVFSMVNRYTQAVSAVIQGRGGTVVEFLGDGVMAVFGAPEPVPDHARAAVEAACEVAAAVRAIALVPQDASDGAAPISVGVGVASGRAFVGNVRTNDRLVYTAVGDVVNLASRIERLTRELDASVAIDAHTHRGAGAAAARFSRHAAMRIRGRAEPVDVYALPLAAA